MWSWYSGTRKFLKKSDLDMPLYMLLDVWTWFADLYLAFFVRNAEKEKMPVLVYVQLVALLLSIAFFLLYLSTN